MAPAAQPLKLAIDDPTIGPEIRKTRITTPAERESQSRLERLREKMKAAGALDGKNAKKYKARLELALDEIGQIVKLEREFLSDDDRFKLGEWPEDKEFLVHDEAVLIGRFVVENYRPELQRYRIAVVMQKTVTPVNRRGRLGTAAKLPGKLTFLADYHAVITLDFSRWANLTDKDRQRLVHHELEHLELNEKRSGLQMRSHDFEEFASIVDRYGLRSESQAFSTDGHSADVLERWSSQLELIPAKAS